MEGLGSLLLFAVFFYLMMRVGCGSHHAHGGDHKHDSPALGNDGIDHHDPVCGMQVKPQEGYGRMYRERLYRFCSRRCLDKFDEAPDRYIGKIDEHDSEEDPK